MNLILMISFVSIHHRAWTLDNDYFWRRLVDVNFCTTVAMSCKITMYNYGGLLLNICTRTLTFSMVSKDASSGFNNCSELESQIFARKLARFRMFLLGPIS